MSTARCRRRSRRRAREQRGWCTDQPTTRYEKVASMKVGMLTGGGDCPGLNAVLRAAVRKAEAHYGDELVGFRDGWKGVVENLTTDLNIERMRGTLPRGGTVLGSSRTNPYKLGRGGGR